MNIFSILGTYKAKIIGFDSGLIVNRLRKECKVISLYTEGEAIYVSVPFSDERKLAKICSDHGFLLETAEKTGLCYHFLKYKKRYGIAFGIILCLILAIYLSNIALKIRIVGTDDPDISRKIKEIIAQEGIKPGAYIPSMNFLNVNAKLVGISDDVAWASIGSSGCVVTVNVSLATHKVKSEEGRIPCNIVASRDGQIVDAQVLTGELCVLIGSAVKKGDILVSGIVERLNKRAYYYHSVAKIKAIYEEKIELEQPLYDSTVTDGKTYYSKDLCFFDYSIPISGFKKPDGICSVSSVSVPVEFLGIELPISIKTTEYTEQLSKLKIYSYEEAEKILLKKLDNYENNLIGDSEIVGKNVSIETADDTVKLTADYTLKGDIGTESPIYLK